MSACMILFLIIFILAALVVQRWTYILQYLFFLRYPLMTGILLVLFPYIGSDDPSSIIRNFFVQTPVELSITSFISIQAAWTVMYAFLYMWMRIPFRTHLSFQRTDEKIKRSTATTSNKYKDFRRSLIYNRLYGRLCNPYVRFALSSLLAFPLIHTCYKYSVSAGATGAKAILSLAAGVVLAWIPLLILAIMQLIKIQSGKKTLLWRRPLRCISKKQLCIDRLLIGKKRVLEKTSGFESYIPGEEDVGFYPLNTIAFALVTLGLYTLGYFLLSPEGGFGLLHNSFPAIGYVILLLMVLCWVLSWFSFQFDKYRLPAEIGIIAVAAIFWGLFETDHFYEINKLECSPTEYSRDFDARQFVSSSISREEELKPLVLVAASGGGIKAAVWTATVLTGLTDQVPGFAKSVRLISSTSGGSIGSMYFVNSYTPDGPPTDLGAIIDAAARPSLSAMAWGLVYPDFLRFFLPGVPGTRSDRGWAQETLWKEPFNGDVPTIHSWRIGVKKGWRPAVVFNATITETGQQLMISNLDFKLPGEGGDPGVARVRSFRGLYPGATLNVATAARLSATFPWVTPISRPLTTCDNEQVQPYHIADGGYYDNFGITSIVQFLNDASPALKDRKDIKILIIRIRASNTTKIQKAKTNAGFQLETIGPLSTMLKVRTASQIARNNLDIELLKKTLPVEEFIFELTINAPLSWQLSESERLDIEGYFGHSNIQDQVSNVAQVMDVKASFYTP